VHGRDGDVRILLSNQDPTVQQSGFSFSGAQIKVLNAFGCTFSVTPASAPMPTIDNEYTTASTTASGLSFNEQIDLGTIIASLLKGKLIERAAGKLLAVIRSGQLGRVGTLLSQSWNSFIAAYDSLAARNFGLPAWAANFVPDTGIGKLRDKLVDLAGALGGRWLVIRARITLYA
jgi:hypothetical protein